MTTTRDPNVKIMYMRHENGRPYGVVAMLVTKPGTILAASSLCRKGDVWDRDLGILKATSRLQSKEAAYVALNGIQVDGNLIRKQLHVKRGESWRRLDRTLQWMLTPPKSKDTTPFDGETAGLA